MKKHIINLVVALFSAGVLLSSCATMSPRVPERKNTDSVFVYGRMDLSAAKDQLSFVSLMQYPYHIHFVAGGQVSDASFTVLPTGVFYAANVEPGDYVLWYVNGQTNTNLLTGTSYNTYYLASKNPGEWKPSEVIHLAPGSIRYLGDWKIQTENKPGLFQGGSFSLEEDKTGSKTDVVQQILPYAKGTQWEKLLRSQVGG